jgi:putative tricarboxylic transport membrane protein
MDAVFSNLMLGFDVALTPTNILWVFIGGFLGTVIGMLRASARPPASPC